MFAEERRDAIARLLREEGRLTVQALAERFQVSPATIRNDLRYLEQIGAAKRTHGGALSAEVTARVPDFEHRRTLYPEEKRRIGAAAASLVEDGETIMIDSGTTTIEVARHLTRKRHLTVITNAFNIAAELLANAPGVDVVCTGGMIRRDTLSMRGSAAESVLAQVKASKAILGVTALSLKFGLTTDAEPTAAIKKAMIRASQQVIVVTDSSKIGKVAFAPVADLQAIDILVTDSGMSADQKRAFETHGIRVIVT